MGLAFVIFFPLGGIIIRFLASRLPVPVKLHYGVQIFSFCMVIVGVGLGIYLSQGYQFTTFRTIPRKHTHIYKPPLSFPSIASFCAFPLVFVFLTAN
jgi:hypothetical protein